MASDLPIVVAGVAEAHDSNWQRLAGGLVLARRGRGSSWISDQFGKVKKLKWPEPTEVAAATRQKTAELAEAQKVNGRDLNGYLMQDNVDDHLLMGISAWGFSECLSSTRFPETYSRSPRDVEKNGEQKRGEEIGYDLAAHIRTFMCKMGYAEFSLLEVLRAAGHSQVRYADGLLSHIQSEKVWQTYRLLLNSVRTLFVDYLTLRQNQKDFKAKIVKETIGVLGCVVFGFSKTSGELKHCCETKGEVKLFTRVWCIFELYCAADKECNVCAVTASIIPWVIPQVATLVDVNQMEASDENDRQEIIGYLEELGGLEAVNDRTKTAIVELRKSTLQMRKALLVIFGVAPVVLGLGLGTGFPGEGIVAVAAYAAGAGLMGLAAYGCFIGGAGAAHAGCLKLSVCALLSAPLGVFAAGLCVGAASVAYLERQYFNPTFWYIWPLCALAFLLILMCLMRKAWAFFEKAFRGYIIGNRIPTPKEDNAKEPQELALAVEGPQKCQIALTSNSSGNISNCSRRLVQCSECNLWFCNSWSFGGHVCVPKSADDTETVGVPKSADVAGIFAI